MFRKRSFPRRVLVRTCLVAASLLATFGLVEWFARTFDPYGIHYPHEIARYKAELVVPVVFDANGRVDRDQLDGILFHHRPNARVTFREFEVGTNSLGLRGPEITPAKPEGTERIVVLGDSVAFGWGVNDEDTFVRRLEGELRRRNPTRPVQVINGGHLVYDSVQQAALLRERLIHLQPDLVLLVYVVNDIEPTRDLFEEFDRWLARAAGSPPEAPGLLERLESAFLRTFWASRAMIVHQFERVSLIHASHEAPAGNALGPEERGRGVEGWERSRRALREMRDLCRARGIPFHVFDHCLPRIPSLPTFCEAEGIPYHDFRFTPAERRLDIVNSAIDAHANALGNELLLRKLQRGLEEAGLYEFSGE